MKFSEVARRIKQAMSAVYGQGGGYGSGYGGWWGGVREAYSGMWQTNVVPESPQNILAFSAVYACIALIANDIAKLRIKLIEEKANTGTWEEVDRQTPFLRVLAKPNRYQTRLQFLSQWMTMKLLYGNTYVLKGREGGDRRMVNSLYILDSRYVVPMVAADGSVFYQLTMNALAGLPNNVTIPASEIIHDRMITLWHPLIGVTPIYACGAAATQGIRIQANSARFFENMSRPSGMLTAPGTIDDVTANRMKEEFNRNFSGSNIGKLFVGGDGLKYEGLTIAAADAQLIEQLGWTVSDVCRAFLVPEYKLQSSASGRAPAANLSALNQEYYNQTLQIHIESIEALLDDGLELTNKYEIEMDLDGLLRMDPLSQSEADYKSVSAGVLAPNEARKKRNLKPVEGGDSPYLQQQNYSLEALAKRDALDDPFATTSSTPSSSSTPALPAPETPEPTAPEKSAKLLADSLIAKFARETANV